MNSNVKTVAFCAVIMVSAFLLWQAVKSDKNGARPPEISYSEFLSQVEAGSISKVVIGKAKIDGQYRDGRSFRVTGPSSQKEC